MVLLLFLLFNYIEIFFIKTSLFYFVKIDLISHFLPDVAFCAYKASIYHRFHTMITSL